jgi:hypothetical protein
MISFHNITLKLMYFAGDNPEWQIYTDSGQYTNVKGIDEIPRGVKSLLELSASLTQRATKE